VIFFSPFLFSFYRRKVLFWIYYNWIFRLAMESRRAANLYRYL